MASLFNLSLAAGSVAQAVTFLPAYSATPLQNAFPLNTLDALTTVSSEDNA